MFFRTMEVINKSSKEIESLIKYCCLSQEEEQPATSVQQHSTSSDEYASVERRVVCLHAESA